MLKVQNINKNYKEVKVLKDISFSLNKGEVITLIGESGAGKTTLLRTILGLEKCESGTIKIDDDFLLKNGIYSSEKEIKKIRKNLGFVFQGLNLFPHMTVLENLIEAPTKVFKISKKESKDKAFKILKSLSIEDKIYSYPNNLSGGEKQRVAIGRALALNPKYLCFDEPTSALDPKTTKDVSNIIKSLKEKNIGILIITHDIDFAKDVSTKIIEIKKGSIKKTGSPLDFFN